MRASFDTTIELDSLIKAYADYLTKEGIALEINQGMQKDNQHLFQKGVIKRLPMVLPSKRITYMLCGAPATGKGELTKRLITQQGLQLAETCRILPDEWHHLLKHTGHPTDLGSDSSYHAILLREETLRIRHFIFSELMTRINHNELVPHCFMEVITPTENRLDFATRKGGQVKCYLTSHHDPAHVVLGSLQRFEATGRLVRPLDIVRSIKELADESANIVKLILDSKEGKAQLEVHDMTYLHEHGGVSAPTKPIYTVDSIHGKMVIYDLDNHVRFFSQKYIDLDAEDAEGLYLKTLKNNLKEIVLDFKKDCKEIIKNMILVDSKIDLTKDPCIEKYVYAHFNSEGELVIDNEAIYEKVQESSEMTRLFLNTFTRAHFSDIKLRNS